eukprot:709390-Pleurochrysis_carterae.AAC.1
MAMRVAETVSGTMDTGADAHCSRARATHAAVLRRTHAGAVIACCRDDTFKRRSHSGARGRGLTCARAYKRMRACARGRVAASVRFPTHSTRIQTCVLACSGRCAWAHPSCGCCVRARTEARMHDCMISAVG